MIGFQADPSTREIKRLKPAEPRDACISRVKLQARIEELAQKSTEGELTEDERAEYAGYVRANKFVAILKRQAQQIANSQS